ALPPRGGSARDDRRLAPDRDPAGGREAASVLRSRERGRVATGAGPGPGARPHGARRHRGKRLKPGATSGSRVLWCKLGSMLRSIGASVLLLVGVASARGQDFAGELPGGLQGFDDLELVAGAFETMSLSAAFRFYMRPERPALYEVMRYRVRRPAGGGAVPTEKLVWYEHPGRREPLRCFERIEPGEAGGTAGWREMASGTSEYEAEMRTLIAVLSLHRTALPPPPEPAR